jgi:hypothetical protein
MSLDLLKVFWEPTMALTAHHTAIYDSCILCTPTRLVVWSQPPGDSQSEVVRLVTVPPGLTGATEVAEGAYGDVLATPEGLWISWVTKNADTATRTIVVDHCSASGRQLRRHIIREALPALFGKAVLLRYGGKLCVAVTYRFTGRSFRFEVVTLEGTAAHVADFTSSETVEDIHVKASSTDIIIAINTGNQLAVHKLNNSLLTKLASIAPDCLINRCDLAVGNSAVLVALDLESPGDTLRYQWIHLDGEPTEALEAVAWYGKFPAVVHDQGRWFMAWAGFDRSVTPWDGQRGPSEHVLERLKLRDGLDAYLGASTRELMRIWGQDTVEMPTSTIWLAEFRNHKPTAISGVVQTGGIACWGLRLCIEGPTGLLVWRAGEDSGDCTLLAKPFRLA